MIYFHYTKAHHLPSIVKESKIRTTLISNEKNEKPAVWLTKSTEWDNACNAGVVTNAHELVGGKINQNNEIKTESLSFSEMKSIFGVCRIKISERLPLTTWAKYKHLGGVSEQFYDRFDKISREVGSPTNLWACSFSPISSDYFESIEMMVGNEWVAWDGTNPIEEFVELCHSCNTKITLPVNALTKAPDFVYRQIDFFKKHENDIIRLWEENKHKIGYLKITVMGDYDTMFSKFVEGKFWKKNFLNLIESKSRNYAYVQFNWVATNTSYKACLAYEPATGLVMIPNEVKK